MKNFMSSPLRAHHTIGTVDVPAKIERDRYFRELDYLELSVLFAGPTKPGTLAKWAELAPKGGIGLTAPFSLTHRKPPAGAKLWPHDASTGDFRDSPISRAALEPFREAIAALGARSIIFRCPEGFSPSAGNRDQLRRFFSEIAVFEGVERVWVPGGLWNVPTAVKMAGELGVTIAIDPLVREPGSPLESLFDLEVSALYLRIEGGRSGLLRGEQMEDLAALIESYDTLPITVAFASPERWQDARNLKKLL
jgi:uncharacterized protein YecE (DUF72 family)